MSEELSKVYSPKEIEDKWYKIWEEKGYFNAQHNDDKPGYSIVIAYGTYVKQFYSRYNS